MKNILAYILLLFSSTVFACGYYEWDGISFYNLFKQTNISASEFYPFLRDDYNLFYKNEENDYPKGNVNLWKQILVNWDIKEIENAIYKPNNFNWTNKNSQIEKRARMYIEFAQQCSEAFNYRNNIYSWDYEKIIEQKTINSETLLAKANQLLSSEKNQQIIARYYYQIIRILHYSKDWSEAISFYRAKVEARLPKNEIFYYITDQVAGCFYSIKNYDKAAYLFTKVLNKSIDRKKSAYLSFNFCTHKNAEGKSFLSSVEDEKDLLLITSLRNFSDEINNINNFIKLDANDNRIELLFMRALNNIERNVWPKDIGVGNKTLPFYKTNKNYNNLLQISEQQIVNPAVKNKDFWRIASSYLSFINLDIIEAKSKLNKVDSFPKQKKVLSIVYEIFSWDTISPENENFISKVLITYPKQKQTDSENDFQYFILDVVAHIYYKNNKIAKAFLVHNYLETLNNINSIELLEALETFYIKPNKSSFEKMLISKAVENLNFIDYINHQKGIYYLYSNQPKLALIHFNKNDNIVDAKFIPNSIFSNNTIECFNCDTDKVMVDQVYKAKVFSFIENSFSRKDLTNYLIELQKLTNDKVQWKAKLANYLLANYYFNISNTGYYRGLLTKNSNCCDYNYINYANDTNNNDVKIGAKIIEEKSGYNLSDIRYYEKHYFGLSNIAKQYYQKVVNLSTDKELNARCAYLMAKCELNDFYNNGGDNTFKIPISKYYELKLPACKSFKLLKEEYSDTKFHEMIIKECSYYNYYSTHY